MSGGTAGDGQGVAAPPLDPAFERGIRELWDELGREIAATGVVCQQSGNCCNFDEWEHVAFATTAELRLLMSVPMPGQRPASGKLCPYWVDRKCTAHGVRPLGCRVFFCDRAYGTDHAQRIYEKFHGRMQELCAKHGETYAYVPMVAAMREWMERGRFFDPERPLGLMGE